MTDAPLATRATYEVIAGAYEERQLQYSRGWGADLRDEFAASLVPNSLVADIGCGPGFDAAALQAAGHRTIGFDFSHAMLLRARARHATLVECDMRALPVATHSLDAIWSSYALLHIPAEDLPTTMAGFVRALRRGGQVCLLFAQGATPSAHEVHSEVEAVEYAPELTRTYVYVRPHHVRKVMMGAGFIVDDLDAEPGAARGAFWVRAHTPE